MPASAAVAAGSVAVSVLLPPVSISATLPRINCPSAEQLDVEMTHAERPADTSRITAKALATDRVADHCGADRDAETVAISRRFMRREQFESCLTPWQPDAEAAVE